MWASARSSHVTTKTTKGIDFVKLLIERGADVNAKDANGNMPLNYAAQFDNLEVISLLLDKGANINAQNKFGITPLMHADKVNTVKFLLDKGADKNIKDNQDQTAAQRAFKSGYFDVSRLLEGK